MITRKTVLVLGAGASIPFGFPSGRTLRDDIIKKLRTPVDQSFQRLVAAGFDAAQIERFRDQLRQSGQPSVDAFLEHRAEFVGVGKTAIALELIPYEKDDALWGGEDNWYEYLLQRLGPTLDDIKRSQLTIITFNYDRSLDHVLFWALRNSYNIGTEDAAAILRDVLRIVHVHGMLCVLPHEDRGRGISRSYQPGDPASITELAMAAANALKIMPESKTTDATFVAARELLANAEMAIFLGFGYLPKNVDRLGIKELDAKIGLTGTAFDLREGDRTDALMTVSERLSLGNPKHGVLEFLRTHRLLV